MFILLFQDINKFRFEILCNFISKLCWNCIGLIWCDALEPKVDCLSLLISCRYYLTLFLCLWRSKYNEHSNKTQTSISLWNLTPSSSLLCCRCRRWRRPLPHKLCSESQSWLLIGQQGRDHAFWLVLGPRREGDWRPRHHALVFTWLEPDPSYCRCF